MGRPPLPLGTWGNVRTYAIHWNDDGVADRFRAAADFRDFDGRTRRVERSGKTEAAARNALLTAFTERAKLGTQKAGALSASDRFKKAAAMWEARFEAFVRSGRRSPGTLRTYCGALVNHVMPALGELRLGEISTPIADTFIAKIRDEVGDSSAKLCRSVLSGVMGLAVRKGAVSANPVREVEPIEMQVTKTPRALTAEERSALRAHLLADKDAVRRELPDLVSFMLATGARIGETLAVLWSEVDLDNGTVEITSTMIRVTGQGLLRKTTKSAAGQRVLVLPTWAVDMLRRRFMSGLTRFDQPVFPDSQGGFRDPSNTSNALKKAVATDESLSWITTHTFRKTTATVLDDAGHSARSVADQLGHARPSMTQDVYMARRVKNSKAAEALESMLGDEPNEKRG
ncbi:MAG TPA: site-specific integrase [Jiangellaceae bacterium]